MIVGKRKPFEEIKEMISPYKKVLIVGCGTCVAVCLVGGEKEVEILKNELEMRKRQKRELEFRFDLDEMRKLLSIPNSYRYPDIKRQILEKSKSEFKKTDVNLEYEPIKEGRKVVSIFFKLIDKSKPKLQSQTGVKHKKDDFKTWRKEILNKEDVILKIDNQIFEIQDGLLAKDGQILDKQEAWKTWKFLFKNKDKISFLNRNELKEEVKEETKKELKEANIVYKLADKL